MGDSMIGIIVAEEKELLAIKEVITNIEEIKIYEKEFYKGQIENKNVIVVKSNVGKVNSSSYVIVIVVASPSAYTPSLESISRLAI